MISSRKGDVKILNLKKIMFEKIKSMIYNKIKLNIFTPVRLRDTEPLI